MLKITRSHGRLIFSMPVPIPGKTVFTLRRGPAQNRWFENCEKREDKGRGNGFSKPNPRVKTVVINTILNP